MTGVRALLAHPEIANAFERARQVRVLLDIARCNSDWEEMRSEMEREVSSFWARGLAARKRTNWSPKDGRRYGLLHIENGRIKELALVNRISRAFGPSYERPVCLYIPVCKCHTRERQFYQKCDSKVSVSCEQPVRMQVRKQL